MPEFIFTGTIRQRGVTFFVNAPDLDQAKERAAQGGHDGFETDTAETTDWTIDPATGQINE